jgi:HAD superfamily hydrolase (TIGR01662 family)
MFNKGDKVAASYKLICFDIDGTLADRDSDELYPQARKFFDSLWDRETLQKHDDAPIIALVTNQGGPACRDAGWGDHFPTLEQIRRRLKAISETISRTALTTPLVYIAWGYKTKNGDYIYPKDIKEFEKRPDWRKPEPGMILRAMEFKRAKPEDTLMVGDSEDDRKAAEAAGCDFMLACEFFS